MCFFCVSLALLLVQLFCHIMTCYLFIYLVLLLFLGTFFYFLRRERNGVNLDGRQGREDLGGVGEWENTIRI